MKKLEGLKDVKFELNEQEMQSINGGGIWFSGYWECNESTGQETFHQTDICMDIQDKCE